VAFSSSLCRPCAGIAGPGKEIEQIACLRAMQRIYPYAFGIVSARLMARCRADSTLFRPMSEAPDHILTGATDVDNYNSKERDNVYRT
jgi:hypothetical protein